MAPTKRVVRHPLADAEAEKAAERYEVESEDAAKRFVVEVRKATERIRLSPRLYPIVSGDLGRAVLHNFPYVIVYRETIHDIQIIAIAHVKRRPGY